VGFFSCLTAMLDQIIFLCMYALVFAASFYLIVGVIFACMWLFVEVCEAVLSWFDKP